MVKRVAEDDTGDGLAAGEAMGLDASADGAAKDGLAAGSAACVGAVGAVAALLEHADTARTTSAQTAVKHGTARVRDRSM